MQIRAILAHCYPLLLVDRISKIELGKFVRGCQPHSSHLKEIILRNTL